MFLWRWQAPGALSSLVHPNSHTISAFHRTAFSPSASQPWLRHGPRKNHTISSAAIATIDTVQAAILEVHAFTGFNWYLTLPIYAILSSCLIRLPFTYYTHQIIRRRRDLNALEAVLASRAVVPILQKTIDIKAKTALAYRARKKSRKQLYKLYGVQNWKFLSTLVGMPLLVLNLDAIRRLCGGRQGLVASLVFGTPDANGTAEMTPLGDAAGLDTHAMRSDASLSVDEVIANGADPTLVDGGMLWFPNLLEHDPYYILPATLGITLAALALPQQRSLRRQMFDLSAGNKPILVDTAPNAGTAATKSANVTDPPRTGHDNGEPEMSKFSLRLYRGGTVASLAVGLITMDVPAALHLYWISSAGFGLLTRWALNQWQPLKKMKTVRHATGGRMPFLRADYSFVPGGQSPSVAQPQKPVSSARFVMAKPVEPVKSPRPKAKRN